MGSLLNIITPLHTKTKRDYIGRMNDSKIECMKISKRYGQEYWDGDRRYGYGGYRYDGRWEVIAREFIDGYHLTNDSKVLDVGCGKGFLLYEIKKQLPGCTIRGFDISEYAIINAKDEIREYLSLHRAQDPYPFIDCEFDLVYSITTLHNLPVFELSIALKEIERVGRNKYVLMEGYRNEEELFNLQCWALTCETFFKPEEWRWLFDEVGYTGDYEFIFFN